MNKKNIKLKVIQNNILENKELTIFEGIAQRDLNEQYKVFYQEEDKTKVSLSINEKTGLLQRDGEVLTRINFNLNKIDECKVSTSAGDIFMDVRTLEINLEKDKIFLYYELSKAGAIVGRFQLRLEWENE